MNIFTSTSITRIIAAFLLVAMVAGCHHKNNPLGPPVPSGATILGGPPMPSAPPPPAGWKLQSAVPTTQKQAQDTVLDYLKRTLRALPAGMALDATGYAGPGHNTPCDDNATSPNAPVEFNTIANLQFPGEVDWDEIVAKTGDIWKSWGWYVFERDGFRKPNRFGYGPDGYRLQIEAAYPRGYSPTVSAISPCFPGDLARDDIPMPVVIRAD